MQVGKECPRLPARHWRAGAPLPQSRSSSKLLPHAPREGSQGHRAARALLELPSLPLPHPSALRQARYPALPSGPQAGGRARRKRQRTKQGKGGTRGAGDSEKQQERGRALAGTAEAASAPRRRTAPGGPGRGIAGEERASGRVRPAGPGRGHRGEARSARAGGGGIGVAEGARLPSWAAAGA